MPLTLPAAMLDDSTGLASPSADIQSMCRASAVRHSCSVSVLSSANWVKRLTVSL